MKTNIVRVVAMMLFLVFIIPCWALEASGVVSDDFSVPALDTGLWTFVNPLADAELMATGSNIEITVPGGTSHSVWTGGNLAPRIMQSVSNEDFEIEVRFDARMNKAYMTQGIVIEQDANNFLRFELFSDGTNTRVFAAVLAGSGLPLTPTVMKNGVIGSASSPVPLYMRVKRIGDQWTQSYSTDGTTWTQSVSFTYVLNVTAAGPYAGNDGSNPPEFTGSIDYFFNTATPIIPGDGGDSTPPLTDVWYGNSQVFGQLGVPQAWVNILGNVSDPSGIPSLSYSVNGGADIPLSVGPDGLRLVSEGDFNIEIAYADLVCSPELNEVAIKATDIFSNTGIETVTVEYICGTTWPETYSVNWSTVTGISDAAQVVDGQWTLATDSIRPAVTGHDRLIAIGDITWDDYEVSVPVTIHSMDSDGMVSLGMRWQGHWDRDGGQPRNAWWPLGAIGGYGWFNDAGDYRMRIIGNNLGIIADDSTGLQLTPGGSYIFKMRAETIGSNSIYSLKVWESGTPEPSAWNLRGIGLSGELKQGSATLLAHKSDVSFGNITITPGPFSDDTTAPAINDITGTPDAFSATVSWTTDEPSTGRVEYGLTQTYEMGSVLSDSLASSHAVTVVGLTPETLYHVRVVSVDPYGNSLNSPDATFVSTSDQSNIVSDDFNSCVLAGLWGFADPVGDVALAMTGMNANISIPAGTSHDLWTAANLAPRIMQPANDKDFEIEVKFDSNLSVQNVMQGVLVEQDINNYLRFDFFGSGSSLRVLAAIATNGTALVKSNKVIGTIPALAPFYMRIKREGSRWTQSYSFDGQTWNTAAVLNHKLTVGFVGHFAGNAVSNPAFTSSIDYFFNTASPINPEDENTMPVTVNISGEGTVAKNPDKSSYSCTDSVELIPSPASGWIFDSWSGDCSGTGACSVTIDGPKTVNATFLLSHVNTATSITADSPNPSVPGQTVTVGFEVAVIGSDHHTPTGNVTVSDGAGHSCTGQLDAGARGSCSLVWTTAGSRSITATYAGSGRFDASTSVAVSHSVEKGNTVTTISSCTPTPSVTGEAASVSFGVAAGAPGSGVPTGNVTVSDGTSSCTGTAEAGSCSLTFATPGLRTLTAAYTGDDNFNASSSAGFPQLVNEHSVITSNNNVTFTVGTLGSFTVTASGYPSPALSESGSLPEGVTFNSATGVLGGVPVAGSARAYNITFTASNGVGADAVQSFTLTVQKASQVISFDAPADKTYGDAPFIVSGTGGASGNPVTFAIVSGPASATGENGSTITITGAGSVTVRASQAGNADYSAAADVDRTFAVNKASQKITFNYIPAKTFGNAPFVASATGGGSDNPVTFAIASGPATATGTNGSTITLTGAGTVTVRASQKGNADYKAAPNVNRTFTVNKANQKITVTSPAPVNAAYNSSFTVSATAGSGLAVAITTAGVCSGSGVDSATVTMTSDSGTCTVIYNQTGNSNYNAAPEVAQMTNATLAVPSAPASLSATVIDENRVRLVWTDTSDNETGFKIEQKEEGGAYSNIAFASVDAGSKTLYGRVPGKIYTYRVRSYNGGVNSAYSNEAVAALTIPNAPTQINARAISASEVVIAWQDNSVLETGFILQRKTGDCSSADPWQYAGSLPADTEEYIDAGLQANTVYSYRMRAFNSQEKSALSECATSIRTGTDGTPVSPTNLKAEAVDSTRIHLSWDDNSTTGMSFRIFRRTLPDSNTWSLYSTIEAGMTEFMDDSAAGNDISKSYSYYVKTCNSNGCSPFSALAEVPHAPAALSAVPEATGGISVAWSPADDNPSGYVVYRKTGDCGSANLWEELLILPEGATSHHDDSATPGTEYSYFSAGFSMSYHHPVAYGYSVGSSCASALAP